MVYKIKRKSGSYLVTKPRFALTKLGGYRSEIFKKSGKNYYLVSRSRSEDRKSILKAIKSYENDTETEEELNTVINSYSVIH